MNSGVDELSGRDAERRAEQAAVAVGAGLPHTKSGGERTRTADFYVAKVVELVQSARPRPSGLVRIARPSVERVRPMPLTAVRCQTVANLRDVSTG